MKHFLLATMLVITAFMLVPAQDDEQPQPTVVLTERQAAALVELDHAERAYRSNKYSLARRFAERAFDLDPANKDGLIIIARSIKALYRDNDESPANVVRARDAIAAYLRVSTDSEENEVYNAVKDLYGAIGENELKYSWVMERATNSGLPVDARSEAYLELALLDLNAIRLKMAGLGEKFVSNEKNAKDGKVLDPATGNEIAQGKEIVSRGIRMAKQAIALSPEREYAWTLECELLTTIAGLFELEGNESVAEQHKLIARRVAARHEKLKAEREAAAQARMVSIDCDVLCNRVVNTPRPPYPPIARMARAEGEVVVQIEIDETGNVISAAAVSGHPLLRAAAVQAARLSTFSPIRPSGEAVPSFGSLIYKFTLPVPIPISQLRFVRRKNEFTFVFFPN